MSTLQSGMSVGKNVFGNCGSIVRAIHRFALKDCTHVKVDYTGTQGIIYVVDSNDRERTSDSREELHHILTNPELQNAPLLVLANKQDLPHALSASELTDRLGLHGLQDRPWYMQASCAVSGDGLYEGV